MIPEERLDCSPIEAILPRKGVVTWDGAQILDWYLGDRPLR
jgi:hypothetical protein